MKTPRRRNNTFVCLDEITDCINGFNPVIYNPSIDDADIRRKLLSKHIYTYYGLKLSPEQLDSLTKYDADQLDDFVDELREIVSKR